MLPILFATALAFAQAEAEAPADVEVTEVAETRHVWTTGEVELKRFADSDVAITTFEAGQKLEVIVDDGELLRVRRGTDFGWIPSSAVSDEEPAAEDEPAFELGKGPPKLSP